MHTPNIPYTHENLTNTIIQSDIEVALQNMPNNVFDLIVTSPPYFSRREDCYNVQPTEEHYIEWLHRVSMSLMDKLKPTGSLIINVKDGVENKRRMLYSFEFVLRMKQYYNETFIWHKTNPFPTGNKKRLKDGFEYCYHFVKSDEYKFFPNNILIPANEKWLKDNLKRKNKGEHNVTNNSGLNMSKRTTNEMVRPSNVISMPCSSINIAHPAVFPLDLPRHFIKLMTEEGDVVFDPFMGSGSTAIAAKELNRNYCGVEQKQEYVDMIKQRMNKVWGREDV